MKFFANIPRLEGSTLESFAFIVFGKCVRQSYVVQRLPDGTALDHDRTPDGWYVCINWPITRIRKYVSPNSFEMKEGKCAGRTLIRIRKVGNDKNYSMRSAFAWRPLEEDLTPYVDDPYVAALNIKDKV